MKIGDIVFYNSEQNTNTASNRYRVLDVYEVRGRTYIQVESANHYKWESSPNPSTTFPASAWTVDKPAFTPTFPKDSKVYYRSSKDYVYLTGESKIVDGKESVELYHNGNNCGYYPVSIVSLVDGPIAGDRVEVSITGEFVSAGEMYTRVNLGEGVVLIPNAAINGRPAVLKPLRKPWKMGENVTHNGRRYQVQQLLTNDWCVLLAEDSTADFKLAHKNDPSFTRS